MRDGEHYRLDSQVDLNSAEDVSFGIASVRIDLASLLS